MRGLIFVAGLALALAGCGGNDQADNTINTDQGLSAESFSSNDVTAIDAVTGDASNMAADVNYVTELNDLAEGEKATPDDRAPRKATSPRRSAGNTADSTPEPATTRNSAAETPANNAL